MLSEVQRALYSRLTAALDVPVFDHVPQDQAHSFVVIGDDTGLPHDTKTATGVSVEIEINIYTDQRGLKVVKQIMDTIYNELHRQPFAVDGFTTTDPQFEASFIFQEPEGQRGVIRFSLTAQIDLSEGES
jgi:hypothetical protein